MAIRLIYKHQGRPMFRKCIKISLLAGLLGICGSAPAAPLPGHTLPKGELQPVRERQVDILGLRGDLRVDLDRREIAGSVTVTFTPLQHDLQILSLDAATMEIRKVTLIEGEKRTVLDHSWDAMKLNINLPRNFNPGEQAMVQIQYSARPASGLYFFPQTRQHTAEAWNYGEGGRHYGWLPLYNDTNDRFTVDLTLTVDQPNVALSNGLLQEVKDNPDGSRSYHWVQDQPIPNYLLALDVGQFVEIPLAKARVGEREIPLSVWAHRGEEERAAYAFRHTPQMIEFFSQLFGYDYAWDKYDQVVLRNFNGAMETTTMVGFQESMLKTAGDPVDDTPYYDAAAPTWSYEDTISHELAHHWFGDLVTCRSLASIFLNESFASYAHTVWNGHINGEDDLTYLRWIYQNVYLDFVAETGTVRPLEYDHYDAANDMYTQPITYVKGALVLHMLRQRMGDEAFYRGISHYLHEHAFAQVDSHDFQRALEDASGQNLETFFEDWIRHGAGFPNLEVSSQWSAERKQVDLTLEQLQAKLPFEKAFDLALEVEIVNASGSTRHRVEVKDWSTHVALPSASEPLMVNVDPGNWLVAYIHQQRSLDETLRALTRSDLAVALRAARQLSQDYPAAPAAVAGLAGILADPARHWGLRQEAAMDLGSMGTGEAVVALLDSMDAADARVRRAAALGLGKAGGERAITALKQTLINDPQEEVAGAAAYSLGRLQVAGIAALLKEQLERPSAYYDYRRLSALAALAELEDPALAPLFEPYTGSEYLRETRVAALEGWARAAPNDEALAARLRALSRDDDADLRGSALQLMGRLHRAEDRPYLLSYAAEEADLNLANLARLAAEEIANFNPAPK